MCSFPLMILFAFVARANAEEVVASQKGDAWDSMDKLVDILVNSLVNKLLGRRWKAPELQYASLDNTTVGKCGKPSGFEKETFERMVVEEYHAEAAFIRAEEVNEKVKNTLKDSQWRKKHSSVRFRKGKSSSPLVSKAESIRDMQQTYDLPIPYTHEGAVGLMDHFIKHGGSRPLPAHVVEQVLEDFTKKYGNMYPKPVVSIDIPTVSGSQLIVVGDVHGQLNDVLCIFHNVGVPSAKNVFLFNGDIADRGQNAVEIFLLIFAFFLAEPRSIFVNRGNHENEDMNQLEADYGGGFYDEVLTKYNPKIFNQFVNAFKVLSLAIIIQREYFVVHGGLSSEELTLKKVDSIDHKACTCPTSHAEDWEDQAFADLLWSDPMEDTGNFSSYRGLGTLFGPDVTAKFLETNGLGCILRSHQLPVNQRGFQKHHGGRVITIFSASNYCGHAGNQGAILVFKPETFPKHEIYEYYAPSLESLKEVFMSDKQLTTAGKFKMDSSRAILQWFPKDFTAARCHKEVEKMGWAIVECKPELWVKFSEIGKGDLVDLDTWVQVCSSVMDPALPWKEAAGFWALKEGGSGISVHNFLMQFKVEVDNQKYNHFFEFKNKAIMQVFGSILDLDLTLHELFRHFDHDGDGSVSQQELLKVLSKIDLGLSQPQLQNLVGHIFEGPPGSTEPVKEILVDDFFHHFTVTYKSAARLGEGLRQEVQEVMSSVASLIMSMPIEKFRPAGLVNRLARMSAGEGVAPKCLDDNGKCLKGTEKMRYVFESLDTSKQGKLKIKEFVNGILKLPGIDKLKDNGHWPVTKATLLDCAKAIDITNSGTINYLEFLQLFTIEDRDLTNMLADQITTVLFRHRQALRTACRFFDSSNNGIIRAYEFQLALDCVSDAIAHPEAPFTQTQIELLVEAVAGEGQEVRYEQFLHSFTLSMPGMH